MVTSSPTTWCPAAEVNIAAQTEVEIEIIRLLFPYDREDDWQRPIRQIKPTCLRCARAARTINVSLWARCGSAANKNTVHHVDLNEISLPAHCVCVCIQLTIHIKTHCKVYIITAVFYCCCWDTVVFFSLCFLLIKCADSGNLWLIPNRRWKRAPEDF